MFYILNPIRLTLITLIALLMYTSFWWVGPFLSGTMTLLSFVYYYIILRVLFTLEETSLHEDKERVTDNFLSTVVNITASVALYKLTPFAYVAFWCAPWLVLAFLTNIFSLLVAYEYVEIKYKNDE